MSDIQTRDPQTSDLQASDSSTAAGAVIPVTLSDKAAARIAAILKKAPEANSLRVSVEGGGCSGFSYKYDLTSEAEDDDFVIEHAGARVVIDQTSLVYMDGAVIDFVDDLMGQSFQIRNPNAVASCGCGTSFSI